MLTTRGFSKVLAAGQPVLSEVHGAASPDAAYRAPVGAGYGDTTRSRSSAGNSVRH